MLKNCQFASHIKHRFCLHVHQLHKASEAALFLLFFSSDLFSHPDAVVSMLARSNSSAGTRLRRAKSSSSVCHKAHEVQNPVIDYSHAGVAAVEAYRRAYKQDIASHQHQPCSKPQKRQDQISRRSEGCHFEESRNRRRMGLSRTQSSSRDATIKYPTHPDTCRPSAIETRPANLDEDREEITVNRPRRAVDTNTALPTYEGSDAAQHALVVPRQVRRAKSAYLEQPCVDADPRLSSAAHRSMLYPDTPYRTAIESVDKEMNAPTATAISHTGSRKSTPREMQTDETIKVAAWDAYLQDFHQQKLRGRKSFIAPLKRPMTKDKPMEHLQPDASIPPYNLANDVDDVFSSSRIPPADVVDVLTIEKLRKMRAVSDNLKSRFKRLIGKSKRVQSSLAPQSINSHIPQCDAAPEDYKMAVATTEYALSLPARSCSPYSTIRTRKSSSRSAHSTGDATTVRSHGTSWTNSTGTGTIRSSGQGGSLSCIDETRTINDPEVEVKTTHESFLGRALHLPLRRRSRANLSRSSEDSRRLYEALRLQIQGPEGVAGAVVESGCNQTLVAVSDKTLDNCIQPILSDDTRVSGPLTVPSIRSVQPDKPTDYKLSVVPREPPTEPPPQAPKGVIRESSWLHNARQRLPSQVLPGKTGQEESDKCRHVSDVAIVPSQEQMANRLGKSRGRWKSPLEDQAAVQSHAMRYMVDHENPYKLHSIKASPQDDYLPVAVRHGQPTRNAPSPEGPCVLLPISASDQIISPSVYSRHSDCRSTTPSGHAENCGTFITVTGREVKRYSLDSPSKQAQEGHVINPSHEWKNWLNTELGDFDTTQYTDGLALADPPTLDRSRTPDEVPTASEHRLVPAERLSRGNIMTASKTNLLQVPDIHAPKLRRPFLSTRQSSIMNDRYPLIRTGRAQSSDCDLEHSSRPAPSEINVSGMSNVSDTSNASRPSTTKLRVTNNSSCPITSTGSRPRVRERRSAAILGTSHQKSAQAAQNVSATATAGKTKSALDLRAVYRHTSKIGTSAINIRRKPISVTLEEDPTLRQITEGPYFLDLPTNKENAVPPPSSTMSATKKGAENNGGSGTS